MTFQLGMSNYFRGGKLTAVDQCVEPLVSAKPLPIFQGKALRKLLLSHATEENT